MQYADTLYIQGHPPSMYALQLPIQPPISPSPRLHTRPQRPKHRSSSSSSKSHLHTYARACSRVQPSPARPSDPARTKEQAKSPFQLLPCQPCTSKEKPQKHNDGNFFPYLGILAEDYSKKKKTRLKRQMSNKHCTTCPGSPLPLSRA